MIKKDSKAWVKLTFLIVLFHSIGCCERKKSFGFLLREKIMDFLDYQVQSLKLRQLIVYMDQVF
jgi:hypothetical protein